MSRNRGQWARLTYARPGKPTAWTNQGSDTRATAGFRGDFFHQMELPLCFSCQAKAKAEK